MLVRREKDVKFAFTPSVVVLETLSKQHYLVLMRHFYTFKNENMKKIYCICNTVKCGNNVETCHHSQCPWVFTKLWDFLECEIHKSKE